MPSVGPKTTEVYVLSVQGAGSLTSGLVLLRGPQGEVGPCLFPLASLLEVSSHPQHSLVCGSISDVHLCFTGMSSLSFRVQLSLCLQGGQSLVKANSDAVAVSLKTLSPSEITSQVTTSSL